jgi:probable HAF family extracellular repeat protein
MLASPSTAEGNVEQGRVSFQIFCAQCHRPNPRFGAPHLTGPDSPVVDLGDAQIYDLIRNGTNHEPPGPIPSYTLTDLRIADIIAYLRVIATSAGYPSPTVMPVSPFALTDLGTLGGQFATAYGVNEFGRVVGESSPARGDSRAFLWDGTAMTDLGTVAGDYSRAEAINDAGQIVGVSTTASGQNRFTPGLRAVLWDGGAPVALGTLGGDSSWAIDINERGHVVGMTTTAAGQSLFELAGVRAFLWQDGRMTDLGTLGGDYVRAEAINDAGQVVGVSTTAIGADEAHAFLWKDGRMVDLGTLGGSFSWASDINTQGQVVGVAETADGATHAFLWEDDTMIDLGTLGGEDSWAYGINDVGQIVGESDTTRQGDGRSHAFGWQDGSMIDLGTLSGGRTSSAQAINNAGLIAGGSDIGGSDYHAALWSAVPNPLPTPTATPMPTPTMTGDQFGPKPTRTPRTGTDAPTTEAREDTPTPKVSCVFQAGARFVTNGAADLRATPGLGSDLVTTLATGTEVTATGAPVEVDDYVWVPVADDEGHEGYVTEDWLDC